MIVWVFQIIQHNNIPGNLKCIVEVSSSWKYVQLNFNSRPVIQLGSKMASKKYAEWLVFSPSIHSSTLGNYKPGCYALDVSGSWPIMSAIFQSQTWVQNIRTASSPYLRLLEKYRSQLCKLNWTYYCCNSAILILTSWNIFKNPLVRDGVRLWLSPKSWIKSMGRPKIVSTHPPLKPSTNNAAKPFVSCESESADRYTTPFSTRTTIHT